MLYILQQLKSSSELDTVDCIYFSEKGYYFLCSNHLLFLNDWLSMKLYTCSIVYCSLVSPSFFFMILKISHFMKLGRKKENHFNIIWPFATKEEGKKLQPFLGSNCIFQLCKCFWLTNSVIFSNDFATFCLFCLVCNLVLRLMTFSGLNWGCA